MRKKSKVSVIVRTYNSENVVLECLKSVFNQSLDSDFFEVIVVDDGSTDDSVKEILSKYEGKVKLIKSEHLGAVGALELGLSCVSTDYFILLDSDDIFEGTILEDMCRALDNNTNIGFVYSDYNEENVETGQIKKVMVKGNVFNTLAAGVMFRKKLVDQSGGYNSEFFFAEYDLLIRLLKVTEGFYVNKCLYLYRRHNKSITADRSKIEKGISQIKNKYGMSFPIRDYKLS